MNPLRLNQRNRDKLSISFLILNDKSYSYNKKNVNRQFGKIDVLENSIVKKLKRKHLVFSNRKLK